MQTNLNSYFALVSANLIPTRSTNFNYDEIEINTDELKFSISLMTLDEVHNLLNKLDLNKVTGLDGVAAYFLTISKSSIAPVILLICNLSIQTGIFSYMWKKAKLMPVYKVDDRLEKSNYRPIFIIDVISKVLERHICTSYMSYLTTHNILSTHQHGFRHYHSCESSLIMIYEYLSTTIDHGEMNGMMLIDFSKAFDLVDHTILLHKLTKYGISGEALGWFRSYLSGRFQQVEIKGMLFDSMQVSAVVPQGLLLFLIFINDLPLSLVNCSPFLFADDSSLLTHGPNEDVINNTLSFDLDHTSQWAKFNNMMLNYKKTKSIKIFSKHKFADPLPLSVQLNNNILGILFDCNLKWDCQIDKIYKTINSRLYLLKIIRQSLPLRFRIQFYYALIYPHLL